MPLTPAEAEAASAQPDQDTQRLYDEIDRQLASAQRASIHNPIAKYGRAAVGAAERTYKSLGWNVKFTPAGQFDVEEYLTVSKK